MIWRLFRRDAGLSGLWIRLLAASAVALVIRTLAGDLGDVFGAAPYTQGPYYGVVYPSVVLGFFLYVIAGNAWTRGTRLDASLPVPARTAWTARMAALAIGALLPLGLFAAIVSIGEDGLSVAGLEVGLQSAAVLLAGLALLQLPSPALRRADAGGRYVWYAILVVAGAVAYVAIAPAAPAFWLPPLAIAIALLVRTYAKTPAAFLEHGRALDTADASRDRPGSLEAALEREAVGQPSRARTLWAVVCALYGRWDSAAAIIPPTITLVAVGSYAFIAALRYRDGESMWWMLFAVVLFLWSLTSQLTGKVYRLDHLPLARRTLFALVMVPPLVLGTIGVAIGAFVPRMDPAPDPIADCTGPGVAVVHEAWEIVPADDAPVIEAPWGETHVPGVCRLTSGSRWVAYNPYSAGEASSPEFLEWQRERAGDARDARSGAIALMTLLSVGLYCGLSLAVFRKARPYPRGRVAIVLAVGVVIAGIAGALSVIGSQALDWANAWAFDLVTAVPLRRAADATRLPAWALWALVPLAGVACYALMQRAFERVEARSAANTKQSVDEL